MINHKIKAGLLLLITSYLLLLTSCNSDDEMNGARPTGTVAESAITATPGETVNISVEIMTENGFSALRYTVNDGPREEVSTNITDPTAQFTITFGVAIPAESLLGDTFDLDLFVIPAEGEESDPIEIMITVGPSIMVPDTYTFTREGESTVSFSGQTDRLNMVSEMKDYIEQANDGATMLSEDVLFDMFRNTNDNGGGNFSFTSNRQLADKTFAPDVSYYEDLFGEMAAASQLSANGGMASEGTAGLIARANGNLILVNDRGQEYTQLLEKGLMGAVFLNQIYNVYMTDDRVGDDVENITLREGQNYTDLEHHWDEAFGYFGVPVDYPAGFPEEGSDEDRFWAKYTFDRDELVSVNAPLMDAYINGRAAIVNRDYATKDASRTIIYEQHELVAAATAVHYINTSLAALDQGEVGEFFHQISEAYMFVNAMKYSPNKAITQAQIDNILNQDFGTNGDFWSVTNSGLINARNTIVSVYTELEPIAQSL